MPELSITTLLRSAHDGRDKRVLARALGARKHLMRSQDAGHFFLVEEPAEVNAQMVRFIRAAD